MDLIKFIQFSNYHKYKIFIKHFYSISIAINQHSIAIQTDNPAVDGIDYMDLASDFPAKGGQAVGAGFIQKG